MGEKVEEKNAEDEDEEEKDNDEKRPTVHKGVAKSLLFLDAKLSLFLSNLLDWLTQALTH